MVNKVTLIGRLGGDPESRAVGTTTVTRFSVATSRKFKRKGSDTYEEDTQWHTVTAWDKLGEICQQYLSKGKQVYVEGELRYTSKGEGDDKRYYTEIRANEVKFLGDSGGGQKKQETATADTGSDVPF
jgi:single-strand DNA-binding protein